MKKKVLKFTMLGIILLFFFSVFTLTSCSEKFKKKWQGPFRIFMPHGSCKKNRCHALDEFGKAWKIKMSPEFQNNLKLGQSYVALLDPTTRTLYLDLQTYKATVLIENKPENTQTYIMYVVPSRSSYHVSDMEEQETQQEDQDESTNSPAAAPTTSKDNTANVAVSKSANTTSH